MAGLYFTVGADFQKLQKLKRDIDDLKTQLRGMDKATDPKGVERLEKQLALLTREFDREAVAAQRAGAMTAKAGRDASMAAGDFGNLQSLLLKFGGTAFFGRFMKEAIDVRGEIEMLESSFNVLLGGKGVDNFMEQLKQFSVDSPLSLTGVADGAQTLLAFNIEAEKVIPTIKQIGDISMGNEERFKSLTLAFAQMSSTGKLMGQDLLQMINAGFNPLSVISEKTGKSIGDLKKEMESGAISSQMVADAFEAATAEGGKFYGMTSQQAEGIRGLKAQLEGALQDTLNNIGESQEALIAGGYKASISLVENYQTIGKVLASIIVTYGTYRAAIVLATLAENGWTIAQMAHYRALVIVEKAQKLLNATMSANPYVLLATVVVGLVTTMWALHDSTTAQEKAQERLNNILDEASQRKQTLESESSQLTGTINSETKSILDQVIAYEKLQGLFPEYLKNMDMAEFKAMGVKKQQELLNNAMNEMELNGLNSELEREQNLYDDLKSKIEAAQNSSNARTTLGQKNISDLNEKLTEQGIVLDGVKKRVDDVNQARKEAEIRALSEEEQVKWLKEQISLLQEKKDKISDVADKASTLGGPISVFTANLRDAFGEILGINSQMSKLQGWLNALTGKNAPVNLNTENAIEGEITRLRNLRKEAKLGSDAWKDYDKQIKSLEVKLPKSRASSSGTSAAEKARKQSQDYKKAQERQTLQAIRAAEDLEIQIIEAEIAAMDEGSAKLLAQMELDHKKQMQALERQKEDALKTKRENARALFEADTQNKGKVFDDSIIKLTEEELEKYQDLQKKNEEIYQKDRLSLELQYMRDYISEYGTFQQQKLAIAQEYDKKIAASGNEYEKKSLEARKQAALSAVDFDAVSKRIDWQGVFGNMTGMLETQLKETLSGLKEYIKTDQFKTSSDTDKKTVYDSIEKLRSAIPGGQGTLSFGDIRKQMDELGAAINVLQIATINEKTAYDNLAKAQKKYEDALKTSNEAVIENASIALNAAKANANEASNAYKNAESNVEGLGNAFRETATDTVDGLDLVADGLRNFASNSLPQIFKGLQSTLTGLSKLNIGGEVGKAVGKLSETLSSASFIGELIGAILSILDILKDGIGSLVANIIDTVFNAIDGVLKDILSGQIVIEIGNSLKEGFRNILNTISFGGFNSLISSIGGGNAKETAETISRLTSTNEALIVSVDALKDEIAGTNGAKSIQAYNEAVNAQQRYNENLRNILDAQMNYSNSHHSNAYYWNIDPKSLKEVNKLLGTTLKNTWKDFSELTADQMNEIRKHMPDVWSEMINQGKYGDRFKDDWNNYADQAGKVVEMTEELRENIAQISFASLRDSFVNALMDMDADAQTFAGNFEEYMTKALLNFAIGDILDDNLKKWYESWTDSINNQNGKLTDNQIEQYRKEWDAMVQQGLNARDEIAALTGYTGKDSSPSQQASKGVYQGMSQDTGDRLEARNTAIHMETIKIGNNIVTMSADIRNMTTQMIRVSELTEQSMRHMEDIKTIQLNSYYELKDINKSTSVLPEMNERLGQMNDKLNRL